MLAERDGHDRPWPLEHDASARVEALVAHLKEKYPKGASYAKESYR